jgi:putative ABC transport system permease protein
MSVIWNKVWSDLWHHKVRTLLAVLSIAAGVFALGAIFGMMDQLTPGLNRVHRAIVPAHMRIHLVDRVDRETVDRLESIDGVAGIEAANELSIRYRLSPDQRWQPGMLVMRADYEDQKYNLLQLKAGEWPRRNKIGIDIRAGQYLNLEFGDKVIFELDGTDRALPLTGKIRHHFITSPDFGSDANFFVDARGLERFNIPDGEFTQLLVRVEPYSEALAREVASEIKDRLGKVGVGVTATFYDDPNEHWGQQFFDGLYLVLQLLAVVSLFMSIVLIFNTLSALITQQTDQIGVMKAIGGRTGTVIKVYLAGVLVYGMLALFVSLPLGAFMAFNVTRYFLDIFNIDYDVFQFSIQALMIQVVTAIAVPLLAGLWPVLSGARITVRQAIASYGLGGSFGVNRLDRLVERLGDRFLSGPKAIALGNMFRRKGRLGLTQLVLITAGTLFLMVMTLSSSITLTVDNDLGRRGYQVRFSFEDNQHFTRLVTMAESLEGVEQAEVWFNQSAALLKAGQRTREAGAGARVIGIPADSDMYRPLIVAGRWLQPGDEAGQAARVIVINEETAEENDIKLGETVTLDLGDLGDHRWQVVGFYRVLSIGFSPDDIYAPQAAIFRTTSKHNVGRELLIRPRSDSPIYVETVTTQLKDLFERRNWDIRDSQTTHEDRQFFDNFFAEYISMLFAPAVIMAIVGGIGLMGSLSISVVERTKEIGVMRAIGAKTPVILGMFIMEGVLQGLTSWAIAVPLSFTLGQPLAAVMGQALFDMNLDYQYNFEAVLVWLAVVLLISTLASVIPARNATSISVRASLAYA